MLWHDEKNSVGHTMARVGCMPKLSYGLSHFKRSGDLFTSAIELEMKHTKQQQFYLNTLLWREIISSNSKLSAASIYWGFSVTIRGLQTYYEMFRLKRQSKAAELFVTLWELATQTKLNHQKRKEWNRKEKRKAIIWKTSLPRSILFPRNT